MTDRTRRWRFGWRGWTLDIRLRVTEDAHEESEHPLIDHANDVTLHGYPSVEGIVRHAQDGCHSKRVSRLLAYASMTNPICVPTFDQDPDDHGAHEHLPGGDPCPEPRCQP